MRFSTKIIEVYIILITFKTFYAPVLIYYVNINAVDFCVKSKVSQRQCLTFIWVFMNNSAPAVNMDISVNNSRNRISKKGAHNMKKIFTLICAFCLVYSLCLSVPGIGALAAGNEYKAAAELVADIATTQYFTDEAVDEGDIEIIVQAGLNAPSAMNGQPWHFSVITDMQQISEGMSFAAVCRPLTQCPGLISRQI